MVVFSRHTHGTAVTQSVGLLSYTSFWKTGCEDVVVSMIDYYDVAPYSAQSMDLPIKKICSNLEDWMNNLSSFIEWSPYSSEAQLLEQFDNLGSHGTKVIVYNLWLDDEGVLELDFDTDETDIQLRGGDKHDHHSLRVYTSSLY